ncbi:MAG: cation-binding protein [Ardenticatenia bacterium]|nr:MAG: cation-binding protein [Ardenticatenia bacterium]
MQATEILKEEHQVILRVIASLERGVEQLERGATVRPGFFADATRFIKGFADGCHHKKEEGVLFTKMEAYGMSSQVGPIAVMLAEHEQGRRYTRGLAEAARRLEDGDTAARADLIHNARGYIELLRQHIAKEDNVLFPMADQIIPRNEHDSVLTGFEHVECEETGPGVHEKYLALAEALEKESLSWIGSADWTI